MFVELLKYIQWRRDNYVPACVAAPFFGVESVRQPGSIHHGFPRNPDRGICHPVPSDQGLLRFLAAITALPRLAIQELCLPYYRLIAAGTATPKLWSGLLADTYGEVNDSPLIKRLPYHLVSVPQSGALIACYFKGVS